MAAASMLVHVTHIDDSIRGRQGPCVYFWGMTHDRSFYLTMELYLESIRHSLETKLPPLSVSVLENMQVCCVLINHRWQRARIPELKLSQSGTIEVFCIDSGDTHTVPLALVRTLDISGYEAENIRECPPLATKFILADVVAPCGPGTYSRQWSELAIMYLKIHVENHTWKAVPLGMYGTHQGVRLLNSNNQLLATIMIQQSLGVAAQTYHEALSMCEVMNKQPAYMKPAFYTSSAMKLFPAGCNLAALSNPVRPAFAIPLSQKEHLHAPQRAYVINNLPSKGRHNVTVSHMSEGPFKFFVQMKSEASTLVNIRKKLNTAAPIPFHGTPVGSPCMAISPADKLFHRGLITAVKDYGTPGCSCTVYYVDTGSQNQINISLICDIPDELLEPPLCAYRVSLFGVQEVSKLCGLIQIFTAFVNSASNLQVEVVDDDKQEVNLYDEAGRSIRDLLGAIFANLQNTTTNIPRGIASSPFSNVMYMTVAEIPSLNLAAEESLFVSFSEKPGYFYGQLEKISLPDSKTEFGTKALNEMAIELSTAYSSETSAPHLYVDVESRLGHHGVVHWEVDQLYYRVRVTKELPNDVEVQFIDYGNSVCMPRRKILAPLGNLTRFRQPPYGVDCRLDLNVTLPVSKWNNLILDKWIKVKMGPCIEGAYSVTFTSDPCNSEIVKILGARASSKFVENVSKTASSTEISRPGSVQLVHPRTPLADKDYRQIRSSDSGNYSITFSNGPCAKQNSAETNDEKTYARSNGSVSSRFCEASVRMERKASTTENPVKEAIVAEQLDLFCTPKLSSPITSTSQLQKLLPYGTESSENRKELNRQISPETLEPQKPAMVHEIPQLEVSQIQKQYFYPQQPGLSGLVKNVEVVSVNDPTDFYVQLSESFAALDDLAKRLNLVYSDESKPVVQNPTPGSACVVQYDEDNAWYRGQYVSSCDHHLPVPLANVFFVDYGNTQHCPIKQIKAIDEEFVKLNPLAFRCKLDGIDILQAWTSDDKSKFENCCIGKVFSATFAKQDPGAKYPIHLVEKSECGTVTINGVFRKLSLASVGPPSTAYTKLPISKTSMDVILTCCSDLNQFYLRPFDDKGYQNQLEELENFYSSLSPNELQEDQPTVGLPCVVRFIEDGRYHRSQVLAIHDEVAEILFVDYGTKQNTPLSQLKRIIPLFMTFPQLTWSCQLKGGKPSSPISAELQKAIDLCIMTKEKLSVLFTSSGSESSNEVHEVDLTLPNVGNVSQYLAQLKSMECMSSITEVELVSQNVNFTPTQVISSQAIISYAESPTEFWLQLEPESVEAIMTRIDKLAIDPQFADTNNFTASIGKPCLAFFMEDGRWYRAVVEAISEDSVTVLYIDYGNSCSVKSCDLRELPFDLAQTPALAYKCCQEGAESYLAHVTEIYLKVIAEMTALTVKFVNIVDGVLHVRIFDPEGTDLGDLCSEQPTDVLVPEASVESDAGNTATQPSSTTIVDGERNATVGNTTSSQVEGYREKSSIRDSQDYSVLSKTCVESVKKELITTTQHVEGYIVYCLSPMEFWFQSKQDEMKLQKIQTLLVEYYEKDSDAFQIMEKPVIGRIYGVYHPIYAGWFRAQIQNLAEATTEVYFVDYGDTQTTPLESIREMPSECAGIPPLATRCSLKKPPKDWSQATVEKFNGVCFDSEKVCRAFFGAEENGVIFVDSLFVGETNVLDFLNADVEAV
ncbi:tudor domain-containing protein 6-like [Daphnia carinata]|uniref:tudor domain-containing protein 6-like n=1 Tax=Daphnia carinata TaxID=120202 RepID=UPI00257D46BF|nr:tudor domain-containing protein 6-like [Daphnia carinata]